MAKFKVGDRVKRVGTTCYVPLGVLGTVVEEFEGGRILARWDWRDDESAYPLEKQEKWLELVAQAKPSLNEAIDAYQQACTDFEAAQLALEKAKGAVQDARLNLRDALDGEA
jgi:hypothetical protein